MKENPDNFKSLVQESLRRQVKAINFLAEKGVHFWDYGNAFLLEASRAGADVGVEAAAGRQGGGANEPSLKFRYPSYMQDLLG
jgi:urocanate hydratase